MCSRSVFVVELCVGAEKDKICMTKTKETGIPSE